MALPGYMIDMLAGKGSGVEQVVRGEDIFAGTDYPRTWAGFVGQEKAKEQLEVMCASARARGARIEHTLLASGFHGVGKSTLATLIAYKAGAGLVRAGGQVDAEKARRLLQSMEDGDVLFIDEIHTMVSRGKAKAEWLLPYMVEGRLYTPGGAVEVPDVAIVGATTDVGRLPATFTTRFMVEPRLVEYTEAEAAQIAESLAGRMGVDAPRETLPAIATAASGNPRDMRSILVAVRDLMLAYPDQELDLDKAFAWAGFSRDGLSVIAREILVLLYHQPNRTASIDSIGALLGEPGPLRYAEQVLMRRGYLTVTGRGRQLTTAGENKAISIAQNGEL